MEPATAHDIGLARHEIRDVRAVASALDHKLAGLVEPRPRRPAGLVARAAACQLLAFCESVTRWRSRASISPATAN